MGLTSNQKQFFRENGYVVLSNIFTPEEVEEISNAYDQTFKRVDLKGEAEKRKKLVLSFHDLQLNHELFTRLMFHRKLLDAASDCVGSPNVAFHSCKAHIKPPPPKGLEKEAYFPHQDYGFFPHEKESVVNCFINVDATGPENGGFALYPGSHSNGPLKLCDEVEFPLKKAVPVRCNQGDVLIFSYLTVHASYPNTTERTRRLLNYTVMAADNKPLKNNNNISPFQGLVLRGENKGKELEILQDH